MIITRTPVRISFLGGGTDYPDHFTRHGGMALTGAIDKYSYVSVNPLCGLFDYRMRISYSKTELVNEIDQVEHPAVRECLRHVGLNGGLEIHYVGDLPARTGMGSSSSFTVGLLHALHAYKGELVSQVHLADEAIHVEQQMIRERVGCQDQYACALGGLRVLSFLRDGSIRQEPLAVSRSRLQALEERLMLFYTGMTRHAHEILDEQIDRTQRGELTGDLLALGELVPQGIKVLSGAGSLDAFGDLLHEGWKIKRRLSTRISNGRIDLLYDRARTAGAVGGKLLGAGGGGFLLFLVRAGRKDAVRSALDLQEVSFRFESEGTMLVHYQR